MRKIRFILQLMALVMICPVMVGQVILRGEVTDSESKPLQGIMVRWLNGSVPKAFTRTDAKGRFSISSQAIVDSTQLVFSSRNFATKSVAVQPTDSVIKVQLTAEVFELNAVVVRAPHTRVKGDTIVYDVASFTNSSDRSIEDVIKKLPGVTVDATGTIYFGDTQISNFYIEDLNLMGNNYAVATRNITPQDIASVSVYQRHQHKRVLKDAERPDNAALNLKLKQGRMLKPIGHVEAGAGDADYALWNGDVYTMFISPKNQTIVAAKGNNAGDIYNNISSENETGSIVSKLFNLTPFGTPSLSASRYRRNKSFSSSANSLFKLKSDYMVAVNTSFWHENNDFANRSEITYLDPEADIQFAQSATSFLNQNNVKVATKLEKNTDNFYLSDNLWFTGTFTNTHYDVRQLEDVYQSIKNRTIALSNLFNTTFKVVGNLLSLESQTNFNSTPFNNLRAENRQTGEVAVYQNTNGYNFYNRESTGFIWLLSSESKVGAKLNYNVNYNRLQTENSVTDAMNRNDIYGYKMETMVSPYYEFLKHGTLMVRVTLPVVLYNMRYTNILTSNIYLHNRPYFNPSALANFYFGRIYEVGLSAGHTNSTGDISNFVDAPIFTTFRSSQTLGSGRLSTASSNRIGGHFGIKNAPQGLFVRLDGSIARGVTNSVNAYNVSTSGAEISNATLAKDNKFQSAMSSLSASKRIMEWNTSMGLNGTFQSTQRSSMRNGQEISATSRAFMMQGKIETSLFDNVLQLEVNGSYTVSQQLFSNLMPSNRIRNGSMFGNISVFPFKHLELYLDATYSHSQISEDVMKDSYFIDSGVRYVINKFEIELRADNLANVKEYAYTLYSTLNMETYAYSLRPRQALLSLRYNF